MELYISVDEYIWSLWPANYAHCGKAVLSTYWLYQHTVTWKGKPQKNGLFFSGPATKRGVGGKGLAIKKKDSFLKL